MIEYYINELISEGITYIPPWSETNPDKAKSESGSPAHGAAATEDGATASTDDAPAIAFRERSDSSSSRSSLQLGATAATIKTEEPSTPVIGK